MFNDIGDQGIGWPYFEDSQGFLKRANCCSCMGQMQAGSQVPTNVLPRAGEAVVWYHNPGQNGYVTVYGDASGTAYYFQDGGLVLVALRDLAKIVSGNWNISVKPVTARLFVEGDDFVKLLATKSGTVVGLTMTYQFEANKITFVLNEDMGAVSAFMGA